MILDVASAVETLVVGEENKLGVDLSTDEGIKTNYWNKNDEIDKKNSPIVKTALDKFRNIRTASSGIHSINKIISNGNAKGLISASVGVGIKIGNTKGNYESTKSVQGNIQSKNIVINAKNKVSMTNQNIDSENLEINANTLELKQGINSVKNKSRTINAGIDVSYDVINQVPGVGISGGYSNNNVEDVTYSNNELNVKNLKLNVKEKTVEENNEIHENSSFDISGNVGFSFDGNNDYKPEYTNSGINISKDGYGIGVNLDKEGKITNAKAKIAGENYDLHADLVYKENRDKLVDDVRNVINTPKAYVKALDSTSNIEKTNVLKEIQKSMLDNNVETETSLRKYKDLLENAKGDKEKISIVKSYYKEIGKLGGKEFKDIVFIDNITNDKGEIAKAATSKDDVLYININNVDILDLDSMKDLITYETKRWKYEDEEVDDNSLHYKQKEIKEGKTKIKVETRKLTSEEMSKLRNYTYVPTFSDKEINNEQKRIENFLKGKKEKIKFEILDEKQKRIVIENMLLKRELSSKKGEEVNDLESLKVFIDNPNMVFTAVDTKGLTVENLRDISQLAYEEYDKDLFIKYGFKIEKVINDPKTGLDGYILEKNGELIIVFRGTETKKLTTDGKNDLQLASRNNDQYLEAYDQVNRFLNSTTKYENKVILFTGHSLGGGIANYLVQRIPNTQAVTFDPAPVILDKTIENERGKRKKIKNGKDSSGYKDSFNVIPLEGALNMVGLNEKGMLETRSRILWAKYVANTIVAYDKIDEFSSEKLTIAKNEIYEVVNKWFKTEYKSNSIKKNNIIKKVENEINKILLKYDINEKIDIKKFSDIKYIEGIAYSNSKNGINTLSFSDNLEITKNDGLKLYNDFSLGTFGELISENLIRKLKGHHQNIKVDEKADEFILPIKKKRK